MEVIGSFNGVDIVLGDVGPTFYVELTLAEIFSGVAGAPSLSNSCKRSCGQFNTIYYYKREICRPDSDSVVRDLLFKADVVAYNFDVYSHDFETGSVKQVSLFDFVSNRMSILAVPSGMVLSDIQRISFDMLLHPIMPVRVPY